MTRVRLNTPVSCVALIVSVLLSGCARSSSNVSGPTPGFPQAENDRVIVAGAVLQAVSLDGNYYVRWNFTIRPKQTNTLNSIRIEDVTDPTSVLLVNDVAPQLDGGLWSETAGLMPASAASVPWLFEPNDTVRTFRFTFAELDGRTDSLDQHLRYSQEEKNLLRATLRM